MKVQQLEVDISKLLEGPDAQPRPAGLHVSDIYRDIENTVTKPGERRPYSELSESERRRAGTYWAMGFAWERVLERSMVDAFVSGSVVRPGTLLIEGILVTPDLLNLDDMCLEEWKCTWKSSNKWDKLEVEFWAWTIQIKAYCYALGINKARLRVYFINGDYAGSGPQVKYALLEFTDLELRETWNMLKGHAQRKGWL